MNEMFNNLPLLEGIFENIQSYFKDNEPGEVEEFLEIYI